MEKRNPECLHHPTFFFFTIAAVVYNMVASKNSLQASILLSSTISKACTERQSLVRVGTS